MRRLICDGYDTFALLRDTSVVDSLEEVGVIGRVAIERFDAHLAGLKEILSRVRPDVVIHTAAASVSTESPSDVKTLIEANVMFPAVLLANMKELGCTAFVNTGTSWQNCSGSQYSPFNVYAGTKQAFEDLVTCFCLDGLKTVTLRLFDTYGPGDKRKKIVDLIVRATLEGKPLKMSPGYQTIDLVHIDDVARAFVVAVDHIRVRATSGHEVFGLSGQRVSLRELADMVAKIAGKPTPIIWGGRPYRSREVMTPFDALAPMPGWKQATTLAQGIYEQLQTAKHTP